MAGTHNYLAGIHNSFFTIRTMTTVHHGLPLGGWYCTISFLFFECPVKRDGIFSLPRTSIMPSLAPPTLSVRNSQVVSATFALCFSFVQMIVPWVFQTLPACSLIRFLLSIFLASQGFLFRGKMCGWFYTRGTWGVVFFPGVVGGFFMP